MTKFEKVIMSLTFDYISENTKQLGEQLLETIDRQDCALKKYIEYFVEKELEND